MSTKCSTNEPLPFPIGIFDSLTVNPILSPSKLVVSTQTGGSSLVSQVEIFHISSYLIFFTEDAGD